MGNEVGRAGFHVKHTKAVSERGAILDEMMRELKDESSKRWAKRNPNIVLEDEGLNIALVNGGEGDLVPCNDPKEVLAYGQQRLAKLSTPVKEPKRNPATGKETGGTWTSSMFVLHLPKSLCREVKDFYPVLDDDGHETGRRRSRWVARDRDEALQYFEDAMGYMAQEVIPGGWDAILGADIQFSESTPHIQVLADTFAPDPKHPGQLRSEFSRAYGQHRDVRDDKGRQIGRKAKFRRYHAGLKEWMLDKGWEIEADVDPLRHDKTATKDVYAKMQDRQRELGEYERSLAAERSEIERSNNVLDDQWENLDLKRGELELEREQLQKDKEQAREEARTQGYAKGLAEGRAEAERIIKSARAQARERLAHADEFYSKAMTTRSIPDEQARYLATVGANTLAATLSKHVDESTQRKIEKAKASLEKTFAHSSEMLIERAREVERKHSNGLVRQRARLRETIETATRDLDDGYEM